MSNSEYDSEKYSNPEYLFELLQKFHILEYKTNKIKSENLDKIYQKKYNYYYSKAIKYGDIILDNFINEFNDWIESHDLENLDSMATRRVDEILDEDSIEIRNLSKEIEFYGGTLTNFFDSISDDDILRIYASYYYAGSYELISLERAYSEIETYEIEDLKEILEDIQESDEDTYNNIDYSDIINSNIDNYKYTLIETMSEEEAGNIANYDSLISLIKPFLIRYFSEELLLNWMGEIEERKRAKGFPLTSNTKLVDYAKEALERCQQAYQSNDLKKIAIAITLALNIQHNFGYLLADHLLDIVEEDLDELSNIDMSEADKEIENMKNNITDEYFKDLWEDLAKNYGENLSWYKLAKGY